MTDRPYFFASRTSRICGLLVACALLVFVCVLSLAVGSREIPLPTVIDTLSHFGDATAHSEKYSADARVITDLRAPRTLIGVCVGIALGTAGSLIQGHTRNALADPGLLGISSGAALAVVTSFAFFGVSAPWPTFLWAFGGALAATALVFILSSMGRSGSSTLTLILGGAALAAVLSSITSVFVLTDQDNLDRMRFWTVGALTGGDLSMALSVLPPVAVAAVIACASGSQLNILNLGDDAAKALGINVRAARGLGVVLIAVLAGLATAVAGPIGFVGLVIPHMVRALTGPDYRWILPYSAVVGAIVLLVSDIVGRIIARPGEIQVGIVLAFVGAPFFLFLILRNKVVAL